MTCVGMTVLVDASGPASHVHFIRYTHTHTFLSSGKAFQLRRFGNVQQSANLVCHIPKLSLPASVHCMDLSVLHMFAGLGVPYGGKCI